MNFRFFPTLLVVCGIAVLAWFTGGFFNSTNVCTDCGAIQDVRRVMWIPIGEVHETPLSFYQKSIRPATPHSHDWMFVGGHGGPIRCALGNGRNIIRATRSPEIVMALKAIRKHLGDAVADEWTDRLLDPKNSTNALLAIFSLGEDTGDFNSDYVMADEEFKESERSHSP